MGVPFRFRVVAGAIPRSGLSGDPLNLMPIDREVRMDREATSATGRAIRWTIAFLLAWLTGASGAVAASSAMPVKPVDVVYMHRVVYTMRASIAGTPPELRASRALARFSALSDAQLGDRITQVHLSWNDGPAIALRIEDQTLLTVFVADLDPEEGTTLDGAAMRAQLALEEAFRARLETRRPETIARGVGVAAGSLVALALVVLGIARGARATLRRLHRMVDSKVSVHRVFGIDWSDYAFVVIARILQFVAIVAVLAMFVGWVGLSLAQFPATEPLAEQMRSVVGSLLHKAGGALLSALPDLGMIVLMLVVARGAAWMLASIFDGAAAGRFTIPGVHVETVAATRRLVMAALWGLTFAALYPFIPGSQSDVFRALSVFVGFLVTLGSTGVIAQLMSGVVLVYARALRVGDFVRIGELEGVVTALGPLSVKLRNHRGDELTLPNASVVAGAIHNYTRLPGGDGARASIKVSIGYDAPWRQVHAILERAAIATPGIGANPPPQVLQRALADFYVEYELLVPLERPEQRPFVLSRLHEAVQDEFNAEGIQIMSPHFMNQPDGKVTVPHGPWFPRSFRDDAR